MRNNSNNNNAWKKHKLETTTTAVTKQQQLIVIIGIGDGRVGWPLPRSCVGSAEQSNNRCYHYSGYLTIHHCDAINVYYDRAKQEVCLEKMVLVAGRSVLHIDIGISETTLTDECFVSQLGFFFQDDYSPVRKLAVSDNDENFVHYGKKGY